MSRISAIAAAVALHLGVAFLVTFHQFTVSSLSSLLLMVIIPNLSRVERHNQPDFSENWFFDVMMLFILMETVVTFCWGLTETVLRLGISWMSVIIAAGPGTQNTLMQLIPTIIVLLLVYPWPLKLRMNLKIVINN